MGGTMTDLDLDALLADYCHGMQVDRDIHDLVAEVRRLRRWKAEALPVMDGLQELGGALGLPLGSRITGREAVDAAMDLHNEARELTTLIRKYADHVACCEGVDFLSDHDRHDFGTERMREPFTDREWALLQQIARPEVSS